MATATYKQLVTIAAEYAANSGCSYALAAKLYKVAEADVTAFVAAYDDEVQSAAQGN